jgi:hypothetical protein
VTLALQFPISNAKLVRDLAPPETVNVCPYVAVSGTPNDATADTPSQAGTVSTVCDSSAPAISNIKAVERETMVTVFSSSRGPRTGLLNSQAWPVNLPIRQTPANLSPEIFAGVAKSS